MLAPPVATRTVQTTKSGSDVGNQIDELKEQLTILQTQSQQRNGELERTNKLLREQIDAVLRRFFGSRTKDAIDPAQLEMAMKGLDVSEALSAPVTPLLVPTVAKGRGKAKRRPLPDNLPTETIVIDPAEVLASPEDWKQVGEERTEELDWVPCKFIKRIFLRRRYTPKETSDGIVIAPLPKRVIDKGLPGPGLLAQIMIGKYVDHLPLKRQLKMFARRYGVTLSRQTMVD
ncbi:MAG: transposase [Verrucomicrobia bacterium]|jgi:transposase|nr:transposase [Verrucomicrobiota bacterium]